VDFGIAKIAEQGALTGTGARGVTPGFSPPEQYSGEGTSPRSDIYALGATLYALLTGEKPPDSISLLTGKVKFDALGPPKFNLSEPMLQAIRQAMQPLESNRPASVAAWQAELQKTVLTPVVRSEPILLDTEATMLTPLQSSPPAVTSSASNSSLWIGVGMGAVVVCIIIGVMAFVFSGGKEPSVAATTATVESTLAKATAESSIAKATIESNNTPEPVPTNTNTPKPVPPTNTNTPKPVPPTNTPKPVNPPTSATNCGAPLASATKYYDRGDKAFNEGNYECAIADFTQAIQLDPKYADAYFYRGMAYSDSDKFEQAMADYNQVIKLDPQNTNIYIEICWEGSFFGKVSEVMDACNKGVESGSPDLPRNSRGIARTLVGDYAGAIEDFKVSLAWEKQNGQSDSRWIAKEEFWITELEAGRNPFDAATLEKLRKGE
jgi:tetratricopeptide (TPR) repeat protein